jgi:nucleoid-associated protein YgaU
MTMPASTRTRVVVLLTSVVVALALLLAGAVAAQADDAPDAVSAAPTVEYTVRSGDTLWAIASAYVGDGDDVRNLIEDIKHGNGLETSVIWPGQILQIPMEG